MNRVAIAIAGAAIAAVSFAVGRATVSAAPAPLVAPAKPTAFASQEPVAGPPDDALRACEKKLALAEAVFRAQEHEKVGDPVPFPDDLPPQYRPDGFENAVRAALSQCEGAGLELGHVDCSEFPCLAFFRPGSVSYGHRMDVLSRCDAWNERFPSSWGGGNGLLMSESGLEEYAYTGPVPEGLNPDDNMGKRFALRGPDGVEKLAAAEGARALTELEQLDASIAMFREAGADEMVESLEAQRATLLAAQNPAP